MKEINNGNWITCMLCGLFLLMGYAGRAQTEMERYDVVISEVMADPSPEVGLPAVEYVELYNRTSRPCQLRGWSLQIGTTTKELPDFLLDSMGFVTIIAKKNESLWMPICPNHIILSSLSITDGGQQIILYDNLKRVIHALFFRKEWHSEPVKRDGGWSLEMKDTDLPCWGADNWDSSVDESGGTPGRANSIRQSLEDASPPEMERITLLDSLTIRVFFSEPVSISEETGYGPFSITPALAIKEVREVPPFFSALDVSMSSPPHPTTLYRLEGSSQIRDCADNRFVDGNGLPFGHPVMPTKGDIIINEVLSHPFDGADADFVELYNKSSFIIDLKDVRIGSGGDTMPLKSVGASNGFQLMPGAYCALCKNRRLTQRQYYCRNPDALHSCDSLPAFANANGVVFLTTRSLRMLDRLAYDEKMHFSGLTSTEGVSLERVHADRPTQDPGNWHSASSSVGFATPGYQNSQDGSEESSDALAISPEVISPDNDGFEDFAEIQLTFEDLENQVSIQVFNHKGVLVRQLLNNAHCGRELMCRWEGEDDVGNPVPTGMYAVVVRWWNAQSRRTHSLRKVVSVYRPH
ncbi:MAG: lamin tail domain-containing protein [Bacteroidales bacterium]|nr:lamin tail domain-containing protein [Bacteroidales bacterium]